MFIIVMVVSLEEIEFCSGQACMILRVLIGTKIFALSASIKDSRGIVCVKFDRKLLQTLTVVSATSKETQDLIRTVIEFYSGKVVDLPIFLGHLDITHVESISFINCEPSQER